MIYPDSHLEEQIQDLTARAAELRTGVEKYKEDSELRKGIITELHTTLNAKDQEHAALRKQIAELEQRLNEYVMQSQSFDVYKVGFHKTLAKVGRMQDCS